MTYMPHKYFYVVFKLLDYIYYVDIILLSTADLSSTYLIPTVVLSIKRVK